MPQQEIVPDSYVRIPSESLETVSVCLRSNIPTAATYTFEVLNKGMFRSTFSSESHPLPPYPNVRSPHSDSTNIQINPKTDSVNISSEIDDLEVQLSWGDGSPRLKIGFKDFPELHEDLPFRSYVFDGDGATHYWRHYRGSLYLGLGEKAAPLDLSNRHFVLSATDCFGYDVHRTDPMYKHIPFIVRATPSGVIGILSSSHSRGYYSVGSEMDGMWGFFNVYRQDFGGLEEYFIIGRTLQEVCRRYALLVGYPTLVPRWAFGYLAGGMKYSMLDEPLASRALMEFAEKLKKFDIPCSGFQLSSGYTVSENPPKTRNVFTWNHHRFPDPAAFCSAFHQRGIRLIANIKPYVLESHPKYQALKDAGAFFFDPRTQESGVARLWSAGGGESGAGGHIDFSSQAGYDFWFNGVKELRKIGIDCMWNDNNEYVIAFDDWELALDGTAITDATRDCKSSVTVKNAKKRNLGLWGRALNTELMAQASHDALLEVYPGERPFVLTRSATPGTMRYACSTWSGDNFTSWDSMRGSNALSINAGICLMQCYGHDIGGFEGPQPTPELLLRWVQLGVHTPRFAINCFKTGRDNSIGDVIEPWMYPEILPEIRKALQRRYELIPYIYGLMLLSHISAEPPQRWVGWGYEKDAEVWNNQVLKDGERQFWLGSTLLVSGVYEAGASHVSVYLPNNDTTTGFLNTHQPFQFLLPGAWHTIETHWRDSIPVLARIGGAIPIGKSVQTASPGDNVNEGKLAEDDWRGVEIFPPPKGHLDGKWHSQSWAEDDGTSTAPCRVSWFTISYIATETEVKVTFKSTTEAFRPLWLGKNLIVILPVGDTRILVPGDNQTFLKDTKRTRNGRKQTTIVTSMNNAY